MMALGNAKVITYYRLMKKPLLTLLLFFSFSAFADQADILAKQRDHFLQLSLGLLINYCPDSNQYICRQQVEIDCSHGDEAKQKKACAQLEKIKELEKLVQAADKNLEQISHIDLPTNVLIIPKVMAGPSPGAPTHNQVSIKLGVVIKMAREQKAPEAEIKTLLAKFEKINAQKIRVDCDKKEDCRYQTYGHNPCGGPNGFFPYSVRGGESDKIISEINEFNSTSIAFQNKYNVGINGLCAYLGPQEEAGCVSNVCR